MKNYHTHTSRCHHAIGKDEDYVLAALKGGFDELGFSDHAPMLFPKGCNYYSSFRMEPEFAADYAASIKNLKNKYADKIDIKLGFELEYYPMLFNDELAYLKSFGIDYLILGQHFNLNEFEPAAHYSGNETKSVQVLESYVKQCIEGLETEKFTYLAHPDLIHFTGSENVYCEKMYHLCKRVKELGFPLEYNFLGVVSHRHYPTDVFWKIAADVGNDVIIGLDAHDPEFFVMHSEIEKVKNHLCDLGFSPLESAFLLKP